MAITAEQRKEVISLLVGMFDAAPSAELLTGFVASIESGQSLESLANDLAATDEFAALYPVWLTNEEFSTNFVTNILDGNTSAAALAEGIATVTAMLNGGSTRGEAANQAVALLTAVPVTDTIWGQAAQGLANKVDVATYFATTKLTAASEFDALRAVVADVDATANSVSDQKILIDAGLDSDAQKLTIGQDDLTGSAGNDAFTAWIFNNSNTAQSGDSIDGGAGTDTLVAELGNSSSFAISLKTNSVEVAHFRAQAQANDSSDNDVSTGTGTNTDNNSQIDAQDMVGTVEFWSTDSRANLVIEDIQAGSNGVTLGWRNSDAGLVNYEVYFDNITAPGATTANSQLFLEVLDLEGMRTSGEPLKDNPYIGVQFSMDGTNVTVTAPTPVQTSYADLVAGINAELATQGLTNVTASLGSTFSAINSDNGVSYEGTTIVLTNTGPEVLAGVGWVVDGVLPPDSNVHTSIDDTPPATTTELTQTNVVFDYVGSGSKSGDFIAGEISQQGGSTSGSKGIQQFNIDVDRDSWLNELRSTEDTLEVVKVQNIGANGSLRIDDLDDVRVFDASGMNNVTRLTAHIEDLSLNKYLNLTDTGANPSSDDTTFTYTMGNSVDVLTLNVEDELVGHEDFELDVNGGNGNDVLTVFVSDGGAVSATTKDWYVNQTPGVNSNALSIAGDAGNDTITAMGGGDYVVEGNAGDDVIYIDQTGTKATWVLGAAAGEAAAYTGSNADDTESDATVAGLAYKVKLTINFNGFEKVVDVNTGTNFVATQLHINNAIKQAIDTDAVLSAMLSYKDGTGNELYLTSKVDDVIAETAKPVVAIAGSGSAGGGTYNAADVTALTATDKTALILGDATLNSGSTDAAIATAMNNAITAHAAHVAAGNVEASTLVGGVSVADNDSVVHADAGSNVVVLASDLTSNNTVVFDETWTKTSIISFEADTAVNTAFADVLDFTAFLDVKNSSTGSTSSEVRVATTLNADAITEINSVTVLTSAVFNTTTATFAGLTAAELLESVNNGGTAYAGLADATLNAQAAAGGVAGTVGATGKAIVMIENNLNLGEYKVFQLDSNHNSTVNTNLDYSAATLLGTIDTGTESLSALTVAGLA